MSGRRWPSPSLVVSGVALLFAIGGTAYASQHYVITSKNQIAPKVLRSLRGRRGPRGERGTRGVAGRTGATGAVGRAGPSGSPGVAGPVGPQGPSAATLQFSGGNPEVIGPITKTFVVGEYTYTNRCEIDTNTGGPSDLVTVSGPEFDLKSVSQTSQTGSADLGSPSFISAGPVTSAQLANATYPGDSLNVAVVSPATVTNVATGATQTVSLIATSDKLTSAVGCSLSGTVTPGS